MHTTAKRCGGCGSKVAVRVAEGSSGRAAVQQLALPESADFVAGAAFLAMPALLRGCRPAAAGSTFIEHAGGSVLAGSGLWPLQNECCGPAR